MRGAAAGKEGVNARDFDLNSNSHTDCNGALNKFLQTRKIKSGWNTTPLSNLTFVSVTYINPQVCP